MYCVVVWNIHEDNYSTVDTGLDLNEMLAKRDKLNKDTKPGVVYLTANYYPELPAKQRVGKILTNSHLDYHALQTEKPIYLPSS